MPAETRHGASHQLRPNGSQAACDPCRTRKVACNHARPVCSRCRSKNRIIECVYSATPTRKTKAASDDPLPAAGDGLLATRTHTAPKRLRRNMRLGYTSSLEETQPNLVSTPQNSPYSNNNSQREKIEQDGKIAFSHLPLPIRETCLSVLRALPGQQNEQMVYLDGEFKPKGWVHLAVHRIMQWLQAVFTELIFRSEQEAMEHVAQIISNNTSKPLRGPYSDCESWLNCFVGENTRWESIGLLWTHVERVSDVLDALIPRKLVRSPDNTSRSTAKLHLDHCILLTRHFTEESDLLADLYRRKSTLESLIGGELGLGTWEAHGAAVNYIIFSGLQSYDDDIPYRATAWAENNRRLAATIFVLDQIGAMVTGRPPLFSHRYYTAPLPLDIRDEDLIADSDTLDRAVNALDQRGWNTNGGLYPATVVRARCMMALVRAELIEVTMGNGSNPSPEYLMGLKDRQYSLVAEFPTSIKYDPQDLQAPRIDTQSVYIKIITHLEHLQNLFFIDRLLIRYGCAVRDTLLETSLALASLTLHFWTHKDQFADAIMQRSFEWMMLSYGAPAAGILCQELLGAGEHNKDPSISRSTIIQQLSLLIGFFNWVRPSAPNAKLCANCKNIIQQVLDQCLNTNTESFDGNFPGWEFGDQPDFNFELMDTFDWLRAAES